MYKYFMRFVFFLMMIAALAWGHGADAADMTVFKRDLYDRITINNAGEGAIGVTDNVITVPAQTVSEQELNDSVLQSRTLSNAMFSDGSITLNLNQAVTDTRHFRIGNRIILDIFYDAEILSAIPSREPQDAAQAEAQGRPQQIEASANEPSPVPDVLAVNDDTVTEEDDDIDGVLEVVEDEPAPELTVAASRPPLADETIVTVSSTVPFGLAVFQRFGRLFVITDQEDMAIPPQVSGNGSELGWSFTEVPIEDGKAWMMPVPDGTFVRPEGKGLLWRLIISDTDPDLDTGDIRRRLSDPANLKIDILMPLSSSLLRFVDPDYGDALAIVTVKNASARMLIEYDFVDFDIYPAEVGAVIKPETDGTRIESASQFVTITNNQAMTVASTSQNPVVEAYLEGAVKELGDRRKTVTTLDRIFFFTDWGGGIEPHEYVEKRQELDNFLTLSPPEDKLSVLLDLVKLTLSQGMGQETLGYLKLADEMNDQIADTSEYQALKGAAHFLAHQHDLAARHFGSETLNNISEARLWYAASLAALGDYEQAMEVYDDNATLTSVYPPSMVLAVNAPLALAALNEDMGQKALDFTELMDNQDVLSTPEARATVAYLKGRAQSVTGRPDEAISNLYKASRGDKLGPFGIRSEMLLIQDELAREVIEMEEAIRRMERLRFAWRGDRLETEIQEALGDLYIQNGEPRKGLAILKRAATNTVSPIERRAIVRMMADAFKSIFIGEQFEQTDPLVAVAVYDEFKELTPVGAEGNQLIDRLADTLMSVNLMSRATRVLQDKVDRLGGGQDAINTALRIARIQLLDREPENALDTLALLDRMVAEYDGEDKREMNRQIVLLKANGLADTGQPEQALFMTEGLDDTDEVIRLRIDTAWKTGQWVAASDNLSKLIARQNISSSNPPTNEQAQLILNRAVALSLSNQYDALQRFAAQYDRVMKQTPSYRTFLVVTRPQNISNLADRETLLDVTSEVDLFKDFLENEVEE